MAGANVIGVTRSEYDRNTLAAQAQQSQFASQMLEQGLGSAVDYLEKKRQYDITTGMPLAMGSSKTLYEALQNEAGRASIAPFLAKLTNIRDPAKLEAYMMNLAQSPQDIDTIFRAANSSFAQGRVEGNWDQASKGTPPAAEPAILTDGAVKGQASIPGGPKEGEVPPPVPSMSDKARGNTPIPTPAPEPKTMAELAQVSPETTINALKGIKPLATYPEIVAEAGFNTPEFMNPLIMRLWSARGDMTPAQIRLEAINLYGPTSSQPLYNAAGQFIGPPGKPLALPSKPPAGDTTPARTNRRAGEQPIAEDVSTGAAFTPPAEGLSRNVLQRGENAGVFVSPQPPAINAVPITASISSSTSFPTEAEKATLTPQQLAGRVREAVKDTQVLAREVTRGWRAAPNQGKNDTILANAMAASLERIAPGLNAQNNPALADLFVNWAELDRRQKDATIKQIEAQTGLTNVQAAAFTENLKEEAVKDILDKVANSGEKATQLATNFAELLKNFAPQIEAIAKMPEKAQAAEYAKLLKNPILQPSHQAMLDGYQALTGLRVVAEQLDTFNKGLFGKYSQPSGNTETVYGLAPVVGAAAPAAAATAASASAAAADFIKANPAK